MEQNSPCSTKHIFEDNQLFIDTEVCVIVVTPGHRRDSFLKQTISLVVNTSPTMADKLLFNNEYWEEVFGINKFKFSFEERGSLRERNGGIRVG